MAENTLDFTAKAKFSGLDGARSSVIDKAIECSELTVPSVFREDTATAQDELSREYVQGFGAKLVNHLVGKFALSILPPSQPFYRLSATQEAMQAITNGDENAMFEVDKVLATKEEGILRYINKSKFRGRLYPAVRIAMITGDCLIEKQDDGSFREFTMHSYVIKRDSSGNILYLIIKEVIEFDAVPDDIRSGLDEKKKEEEIELYTMVYLEEGKYKMFQEIEEELVSGSEQELASITDRFISIRWNKLSNEDYGRGFVEDHLGTLIDLNKQMKVLSESAVLHSKTVFTVNPNGMTKYKDFIGAKNGDAIVGQEQDIGTIKVQKAQDLSTTYNVVQDYKRELSEAFLMSSASIRDAERVTAHEVQMVASELEASFGGIYTAIAEDIQMPLIENAMKGLKIDGGDDIDVIITAGVEALGRNVELAKINNLMQELGMLAQLVGNEQVAQTINVGAITSAMVANSGVASKNFLYSKAQQDQVVASQREEAIAQQMVQGGMPTLGQNIANQMIPQGGQ